MKAKQEGGVHLHQNQAVVRTASIDVKILRLEKRQLTQSVFRQLDNESIFSADGTLRGTPWGRINYTWNDNRSGTAFHVLFQRGDYLFRSPVPYLGNMDSMGHNWPYWLCDRRPIELLSVERDNGHSFYSYCDKQLKPLREAVSCEGYRSEWEIEKYKQELENKKSGPFPQFAHPESYRPFRPWRYEEEDHLLWQQLAGMGLGEMTEHEFVYPPNLDSLRKLTDAIARIREVHFEKYRKADEDVKSRRAMFWQRVAEMGQLEQLFIAV